MHARHGRTLRWLLLVATCLGGGTMFGTCEVRLHDAIVNGTELWINGLLNPSNISLTPTTGN